MEREKLIYVKVGDGVLDIDLHNNYIVTTIANYNYETKKYDVKYYIREKSIGKLNLIETLDNVSFDATRKTICHTILKHVSTLFVENYFKDAIDSYEYENKCFELGNEVFELQRQKYSNNNE